jgi:hypothetical protein
MKFSIIISLLFLLGCSTNQYVKEGSEVILLLKLTNKEGKIIDESGFFNQHMPLKVIVGKKEVFSFIDNALVGMKLWEVKEITLPPKEAYGRDGVFYLNDRNDTIYVVSPSDTLLATVKVIRIGNRH